MTRPTTLAAARFHARGRDRWANPGNMTSWQAERTYGRIVPMEVERPAWWRRILNWRRP